MIVQGAEWGICEGAPKSPNSSSSNEQKENVGSCRGNRFAFAVNRICVGVLSLSVVQYMPYDAEVAKISQLLPASLGFCREDQNKCLQFGAEGIYYLWRLLSVQSWNMSCGQVNITPTGSVFPLPFKVPLAQGLMYDSPKIEIALIIWL